jgi:hypothetical protein
MATFYDYIVVIRATPIVGDPEEYRHQMQAYSAMEAVTATMLELDAEHQFSKRGVELTICSVRPDVEKVSAQTRALTEQLARDLRDRDLLRKRR